MIVVAFVFLLQVLCGSCDGEEDRTCDRYIVSCRSTDFACFQAQYQYLRDIVLLGCRELELQPYEQYYFQYSDTDSCVHVSGTEASQLVGFSFNGTGRLLSLMVSMPVRFHQVLSNWTYDCQLPDKAFPSKGYHVGPYKKFAGNATLVVQFPFKLEKKGVPFKDYLVIEDEALDVTLDVPDLSNYNRSSPLETRVYEWSEWAYEMVQHVDVPEHIMVPFLNRMKAVYTKLPLERLIALYPSESYQTLSFKYSEPNVVLQEDGMNDFRPPTETLKPDT